MTTPAGSTPEQTPAVTAGTAGAQAVITQAQRLGLIWELRYATVKSVTADQTAVLAAYDNDIKPIPMINLYGVLTPGTRVAVLFIPPQGNYIIAAPAVYATYTKLAESILVTPAADITFPNISQSFRSLQLHIQARGDTAAQFTTTQIQFNGDTGANYNSQQIAGNNVTIATFPAINQNGADIGETAANTATANCASIMVVTIPNYVGAVFFKQLISNHQLSVAGQVNTGIHDKQWASRWLNTAAISSIRIFPAAGNFIAGSSFVLYGLP